MQMTFRAIERWPGTLTKNRQRSRFKSSYGGTLSLLERELEKLGASAVTVQAAVRPEDIRLDGRIRGNAKAAHPGIILSFQSRFGPLSYPCDTFDDWTDNLRAIALALEHLRAVDRYGVTKRGEQYKGWEQLPYKNGEMSKEDAQALLARYGGEKPAIMATHPDRGGNADDFKKVQDARRILGLT